MCKQMIRVLLTPGPRLLAHLITFKTILHRRNREASTSAAMARQAEHCQETQLMPRRSTTLAAVGYSALQAVAALSISLSGLVPGKPIRPEAATFSLAAARDKPTPRASIIHS